MTFEQWLESSECPSMYDALDAAQAAWDKATEIERARCVKILRSMIEDFPEVKLPHEEWVVQSNPTDIKAKP